MKLDKFLKILEPFPVHPAFGDLILVTNLILELSPFWRNCQSKQTAASSPLPMKTLQNWTGGAWFPTVPIGVHPCKMTPREEKEWSKKYALSRQSYEFKTEHSQIYTSLLQECSHEQNELHKKTTRFYLYGLERNIYCS